MRMFGDGGTNSLHRKLKPGGAAAFHSGGTKASHAAQSGTSFLTPTGYGCVGDVFTVLSWGTGRSSIGMMGSPVSRSKTKKYVSVRRAAIAFLFRPPASTS